MFVFGEALSPLKYQQKSMPLVTACMQIVACVPVKLSVHMVCVCGGGGGGGGSSQNGKSQLSVNTQNECSA